MQGLKLGIICCFLGVTGCTKGCSHTQGDSAQVVLSADKGFNFPPGFPSDPGEAGKKMLEGIDADHDGVRDDIQRWIYARYPNDEKKRKALSQMAKSYQENLRVSADRRALESHSHLEDRALECLDQVFPYETDPKTGRRVDRGYIEMGYLKAKIFNTRDRTEKFFEIDARYDGWTFPGLSKEEEAHACDP